MNRRIILLTATVLAVTGCFFMQGCIQQHAPAFPEIASIQADTTVLLKPEVELHRTAAFPLILCI